MARSRCLIFIAALIFSSMGCYALETSNANLGLNIAKIQKLTGQTGQLDQDQKIYKITIPRDDLKILMSGMQMTSEMGLSSWVAFKKTDNQTSVNGDLILLQDQINPVMSVALTNGLQVTGLHNPYLWDSPRVMFMHITGEGDELQLANAIGQVLKKIKATSNGGGDFPLGSFDFLRTTLDAHKIDVILGQKGQFKDDVYKIEFGDGVKATDTEANKVIALNTWAAFAGSDSEAVVNGTIVLHESELQKALVKLRNAQIYVLAIYQNMINTEHDLVLINFWGVGNTQTLARTLRSVFVIAQNSNPPNITVGGIVPDSSTINTEAGVGMTPIQLSLYKNDNCGYTKTKELYTFIDTIQNINADYANQLGATLRIALHLTQKMVLEKMAEVVSFLPATSQIIQSKKENAQELPSAKNLLLKLSVVSNNVPEFVKLLASTPAIASDSTKSLANVISVSLSNADARFHVYSTELIKSYTDNIKLHINSISSFLSGAVTYAYAQINKFVASYTNVFESLARAVCTAVAREYTQINEFLASFSHMVSIAVVRDVNAIAVLSVNVSQSVDHAVFTAVTCVETQINKFAISSVNIFQSVAHVASAVVARIYSDVNECAGLSANVFQSFAHAVSMAVLHVYADITEFILSSINVFQSLSHAVSVAVTEDIKTLSALSINVSQSVDDATFTAVAHVYAGINEFGIASVKVSKSIAHAVSVAVAQVYVSINKFAVLSMNVFQSFAHAVSMVVLHVYADITEFILSSINVFQSLSHAVSVAVTEDIKTLSALPINVSQSVDDATFTAVAQVSADISKFAISSVNFSKSVSHAISVTVAQVYVSINKFAVSSTSVFQSFAHAVSVAVTQDIKTLAALSINVSQSVDDAAFTAVAHVYAGINEFAIASVKGSKSIAHAVSVAVTQDIKTLAALSMNMSQSFDYGTFTAIARLHENMNEFVVLCENVFKSLVSNVSNMIAYVRADINESAILSVNVFQSFVHAVSATVARMYASITEYALSSISVSQSLAHAVSIATACDINRLTTLSVNASKEFDYVTFATVARVNTYINEFTILSVSISKSLAHTTSFILSEAASLAHSYTTGFKILFKQSFSLFKNTVAQLAQSSANQSFILLAAMKKSAQDSANSMEITQLSSQFLTVASETRYKIPSMLKPITKILSPMLLSPLTSPILASASSVKETEISQSEKTTIKSQPVAIPVVSGQPHNQLIKSLSATLPVAQHKSMIASSRKIVPASLPMPQHKVIRVATLSTLSSVMPVTHHKVRAVPVVQHKAMKVAKLSPPSLPHAQPAKNHPMLKAKSVVKPFTSFAQAKTVKHREQLNKEKLHEIAHAMPHEKNWNTEQLAPGPKLPIHVAKRHMYHAQEEFDDGPAVVGAYPYDEEPTPGGFGG